MSRIPEGACPDIKNKSWSITADVDVKARHQRDDHHAGRAVQRLGALPREGQAGLPLQLRATWPTTRSPGKTALAPGKHTIKMDFAYDGGGIGKGGTATLAVDDKEVAKGRIETDGSDPHLARRGSRRRRGHRHAGEPHRTTCRSSLPARSRR